MTGPDVTATITTLVNTFLPQYAPYVQVATSLAKMWGQRPPTDTLEAITDSIPPESIGAKRGPGGFWIDAKDGHQLTHTEASARQHQNMAARLHCRIEPSGWWDDTVDGHRLTHDEAYARYEAIVAAITRVTPR